MFLVNFYQQKKGKMLVPPWAKTMFGRRATWDLEYLRRDNIEEWSLFWHFLVYGYILSLIFITIGVMILLIDIGVIHLPSFSI